MDFTPEEFARFKRLVDDTGSPHQMVRLSARLALRSFVDEHGKAKCDAMFAKLTEKPLTAKGRKAARITKEDCP